MVVFPGGDPRSFSPLIDLYRDAGRQARHSSDRLRVGLQIFGYVGATTQEVSDTVYSGWAEMLAKISVEQGVASPTRHQFEAATGPDGAFVMGDPPTVADKLNRVSEQLGGLDRISLHMGNPRLARYDVLRGIELLGTKVVPLVGDSQ